MNWDAVGAIAELAGAGAVVLTLIYLSVQLRQNTAAVRHAAERGILEDGNTWIYKLVEDSDLAELYRKGLRGEALSANDRFRFTMLLGALFQHWNHAYRVRSFEIVDNANTARVVAQPGGAEYWRRAKEDEIISFDAGFVSHVDGLLAKSAE